LDFWAFHPFGKQQWVVGGSSGLLLFDARKEQLEPFRHYNQFTELAQAHILHIAPDRQGMLWICANTGLYTMDPQKGITARYWSRGKEGFYLPAESFQHFYQDTAGTYWLATANVGLIRWDRRQNLYRQFRRSEGLSNNNIYAVYPDAHGYLWMSSDYGIMRFDPKGSTTRSFFVEDGVTYNEFNRIAHYQDKDGRIYFGGLNGITAFDPSDFQTEKLATGLPLRITSFRQYDDSEDKIVDKTEEVVTTNTIILKPNDHTSVLDFALLNYSNAEKNVYAYQFTGLDKDWIYQTEPTLRLSNLPYGQHQVLIKAQSADGQWSANTLAIKLIVMRPFYLRTWFLLGMVLLLGAGIGAWLRWRIWRHQAEQTRLQREIRQATARIEEDKEIIGQQAQDLRRLIETRSHFFTNISHEFRTPLTVILGIAAELKRTNTPEWVQKFGRMPDLIERNGSNLLRLINQILDLSKIEAGEMQLHPVQTDLVAFTRYLVESFHSGASARDIELHVLIEEETCLADIDRDKLGDILSNLLSNALKFTPKGGHIYCGLKLHDNWQPLSPQGYHEELAPISYLDGPWIGFNVSDNGPGIEPGSLPKIFNRFYQAPAQPASQTGGTGIGLSLVRELVQLMQGSLAARNLPGGGAEFVVSLPLTRKARLAGEPLPVPLPLIPVNTPDSEPEGATLVNGPTLLLVEDNDDVAAYIHTCLETEYLVIRARNGQAGIELAVEKMPDIIVSDIMMPLKDGFELCGTLKNDARTSHIPIVLLTAKAAHSDRLAGLRRGADAYLLKPFRREELRVVLANLIGTRRMLQAYYSQLALGAPAGGPAPAAIADSLEDEFVLKLRATLEAHLDNPELSVDTLCQQMGMSRTSLHLKVTALTGMSISHYVRSLRLRKAQELLITSGLNISQVAYAVGFDNPKYFSRVFSEEFGVSPANYRLSARG
jgi:signal transduction histidine kinase/DNA-binding response OmpR family regulator